MNLHCFSLPPNLLHTNECVRRTSTFSQYSTNCSLLQRSSPSPPTVHLIGGSGSSMQGCGGLKLLQQLQWILLFVWVPSQANLSRRWRRLAVQRSRFQGPRKSGLASQLGCQLGFYGLIVTVAFCMDLH